MYKDIKSMSDNELINERSIISRDYQKAVSSAKTLQSRLGKIKHELRLRRKENKEFFVSDHALVRYLERVKGLDVESLTKEISDIVSSGRKDAKTRECRVDGIVYAFSEDLRCITTIIDPSKPKR